VTALGHSSLSLILAVVTCYGFPIEFMCEWLESVTEWSDLWVGGSAMPRWYPHLWTSCHTCTVSSSFTDAHKLWHIVTHTPHKQQAAYISWWHCVVKGGLAYSNMAVQCIVGRSNRVGYQVIGGQYGATVCCLCEKCW